jgi:hypothetical protein
MILSQRWLGARQLGVKAFKSGGLGMCVHPGLEKMGGKGKGGFWVSLGRVGVQLSMLHWGYG